MAQASKTYEEYLKQQKEKNTPLMNENIATNNAIYDTQKQNVNSVYQQNVRDTVSSYEDALRSNETQKILNSRNIERRMAEMGLTDSGLNRTQQAAVQLSAANNAGAIQRDRQKAIDTLARAMASEISTIEANRAASEQGIRTDFENKSTQSAVDLYNADLQSATDIETAGIEAAAKKYEADVQATTERLKNEQAAKNKNNYFYTGVNDENGYLIYQNIDGDTRKVAEGYNPNGYNSKAMYADEYQQKGTIKWANNGYQPLGLFSEGGNFAIAEDSKGETITYDGQQVYYTPNGNFVVWNENTNKYDNINKEVQAYEKSKGIKALRPTLNKITNTASGYARKTTNATANKSK